MLIDHYILHTFDPQDGFLDFFEVLIGLSTRTEDFTVIAWDDIVRQKAHNLNGIYLD